MASSGFFVTSGLYIVLKENNMIKHLSFFIFFLTLSAFGQDTLKLYYGINQFELSEAQKATLDKNFVKDQVYSISIFGYTDYLGTKEYNLELSKKRADEVWNYFLSKKINAPAAIGSGETGEVLSSNKGIKDNRKVEIIFHRKSNAETARAAAKSDTLNINLDEIKIGDKLVLDNFNFIPGRHYLVMESKPELSRLIDIMLENPKLKIELHGHICCETDHNDGWDIDAMNYKLSVNRAKYIYDQLVKNGVAAERLQYKGFGRSNPLFPLELDDNEKARNRRVEILILEK